MLQQIDRQLFDLINRDLTHRYLDLFFSYITDIQKTLPFILLLALVIIVLLLKKRWRAFYVLLFCAIGCSLINIVNGNLVKQLFQRDRPLDVILRTTHHGSYSFPSGHSTNVFFIAMFIGMFYPRLRFLLIPVACLMAYSRVYCGVHYPGDVLAGALFGTITGYLFFKGIDQLMKTKLKAILGALLVVLSFQSFANVDITVEDPTNDKPFFPWIWEDQLKPTLKVASDKTSLTMLASGTVAIFGVHEFDGKIYDYNEGGGNLLMDKETATDFGKLGNGLANIGILAIQYVADQENSLRTARALILTSVSHVSIAAMVRRNRPGNRQDFLPFASSFPSGHTSSAFAMAGSMAYSYGWVGAVPAYTVASAIAISRIRENRHWASDIVGGAFLGTFWARASFGVKKGEEQKDAFMILPMPVYDGGMISAVKDF